MSKLAHPGASSTVSPGRETRSASSTAASRPATTVTGPPVATRSAAASPMAMTRLSVGFEGDRAHVEALVAPAGDEHHRRIRPDGGDGGVGVGRLGVVDPGDPVPRADDLAPMVTGAVGHGDPAHPCCGGSEVHRRRRGRRKIDDHHIVAARQGGDRDHRVADHEVGTVAAPAAGRVAATHSPGRGAPMRRRRRPPLPDRRRRRRPHRWGPGVPGCAAWHSGRPPSPHASRDGRAPR